MSSRRAEKAAEAIREVVSMAILTELQDPRIRDVTVTFVEVAADLRHAKIHVSVMGDDTRQNLSLRGLQSAAGFLQSKIAKRIETRYTPRLSFVLDQGVKRSIAIAQILREVLPPDASPETSGEEDFEEADDTAPRPAVSEGAEGSEGTEGPIVPEGPVAPHASSE